MHGFRNLGSGQWKEYMQMYLEMIPPVVIFPRLRLVTTLFIHGWCHKRLLITYSSAAVSAKFISQLLTESDAIDEALSVRLAVLVNSASGAQNFLFQHRRRPQSSERSLFKVYFRLSGHVRSILNVSI